MPSLSHNLLSVAQMMCKNYSLYFAGKECKIYDPSGVEIAKVQMFDNAFPLSFVSLKESVLSIKTDESFKWHKRFGHFNLRSLKFMQSNGFIRDMPEIFVFDEVYGSCQERKLHR